MDNLSISLSLYSQEKRQIATVALNGYFIRRGGPLGRTGAMRSFKLLQGDLWEAWHTQTPVTIRSPEGDESQVRIAALPVETDGFGLLEFL